MLKGFSTIKKAIRITGKVKELCKEDLQKQFIFPKH